ncbi:hypothetical protein Tco_1401146 [Tanacetum coccineum]
MMRLIWCKRGRYGPFLDEGMVIVACTITTTIPDTTPSVIPPSTHIDMALTLASPDYTPASPDYSPASDTEFDPSKDPLSDHIPPLPATSPFLSLTDDSSDNDIPDTPPSPTHVMVLASGQPIPYGRPYRYHLNGPVHMMTVRKRVKPLPTHRLVVRHSVDYSSSDHFALDDSLRDSLSSSSSSSSSETSSDPSSDDLSDSSSDHSLPAPSSGMRPSHHLCSLVPSIPRSSAVISDRTSHDSSFTSPSRKRSRSLAASVPLSSPIPGALSYVHADLLPSSKRGRSPESSMDLEAKINEFITYADALRDRGIDARVVVEAVDREEIEIGGERAVEVTYETLGDLVQRFHDHTEEILVHRVQAIESVQRDQGTIPNTRSGASRTREGDEQGEVNGNRGNRNGGNGNEVNRNKGNGNGGSRNGGNGNGGNRNG